MGIGRSVRTWIVVPAAGSGTRFSAGVPKQYADLGGRPMLVRTLERLAVLGAEGTLVALAPDDTRYDVTIGRRPGVVALRCGGATRGATVRNALEALGPRCADDDWIVVHDAARPCVSRETLLRLAGDLADEPVGGLLAMPLAETLKRAEASGESPEPGGTKEAGRASGMRVLHTEARDGFWLAQTPQMFRYRVLVDAYHRTGATDCTDDAQAIEQLASAGGCARPRLVRGSSDNLKITRACDLALALAILALQGEP